jgi:hypothetical protein
MFVSLSLHLELGYPLNKPIVRAPLFILAFATGLVVQLGVDTGLAQNYVGSSSVNADQPIQMQPVEVFATRPKVGIAQLKEIYEKLNHLADGPFPQLRNGYLIEDILWRHRYLGMHPDEDAIIVVDARSNSRYFYQPVVGQVDNERLAAATAIYTKAGEVYAGSMVFGEAKRLKGFSPEDLHTHDGWRRIMREINKYYVDILNNGGGSLIQILAGAQFSTDYSILNRKSTGGEAALDPFNEKPEEVLDWCYHALHDPSRAGLIPVALSSIAIVTPDGKPESVKGLVFDWDGVHYFYHPDLGTYAKSLPPNPETGLTYLCVKNGAWLENIYFCAAYLQKHPGEKAVSIPGEPLSTAYTAQGRLYLFTFPFGKFTLPPKFGPEATSNTALLAKLRDLLVSQITAQRSAVPISSRPNLISDHMPGDDVDMQLRRVFLDFQAAGIPVHLNFGASASVEFTWQGVDYKYGSDQQVLIVER